MKTSGLYLAAVIALASCSGGGDNIPVPRPVAYPRIELPDSTYSTVDAGRVSLQLNSAATYSADSVAKGWITVTYPQDVAAIYITATDLSPENADQIIDNRIERLSINTGGLPTEMTSFITPARLHSRILTTPSGTPTPVQFIITDHKSILVSGSATARNAASAPADSIVPIVKMLERDIIHLSKTLSVK